MTKHCVHIYVYNEEGVLPFPTDRWTVVSGNKAVRPATHDMLKKRKYRLLYSSGRQGKSGPKGPSPELIQAIVELKQRNLRFGCHRIAQQITKAFGIDIDKDVVRRVLAAHYRPGIIMPQTPVWNGGLCVMPGTHKNGDPKAAAIPGLLF